MSDSIPSFCEPPNPLASSGGRDYYVEEQTPFKFQSITAQDPQRATGLTKQEYLILVDVLVPKFVDALFLSDAVSIAETYRQHQDRTRGCSLIAVTPQGAIEQHRQRAWRIFDDMLDRKILRKLSPGEIAMVCQHRVPAS